MALNRKGGKWEGGYISVGTGGRETFVLEREVRGHRFHLSTRTHSRRAALKHLERFEADPFAYRPEGVEADEALTMTQELIDDFWTWQIDVKGNTSRHANSMANMLGAWLEDLRGKDLKRLSLRDDLKRHLQRRPTSTKHRIIAIKSFFAWLRREKGLLITAQDPTLDLPVPQATPEKRKRRKAVPWSSIVAVAAKLTAPYRDVLEVLVGTGMHLTELYRFAHDDESELVIPNQATLTTDGQPVHAVLVTRHKSGDWTRIPLTRRETVDAAARIRAARVLPKKPTEAFKTACGLAKVPVFTAGVMRHSVATWAVERGASPDAVAEFLGHKDKRTTMAFYADVAIPTRGVPTLPLPALETLN